MRLCVTWTLRSPGFGHSTTKETCWSCRQVQVSTPGWMENTPGCRWGQLKIGLIAQERKPHLTNDVQNDERISHPEWAKREGMVAFAGYPLVVEEVCLAC